MTREKREEAIEKIRCLQKYSENNEYWWLRDFMEPFNMAIEALEQTNKIADIVDGIIDHFEYADAMDMLYEIKGVIK